MSRTLRERIARFIDPASYFALDYLPSDFESIIDVIHAKLAAARAEVQQLKFLLASAPMIDAPHPVNAQAVFSKSRIPFAYIHPKTFAQYSEPLSSISPASRIFVGSPTKWVMLSLMPEGRVIYSPFAIPGLEKNLAGA